MCVYVSVIVCVSTYVIGLSASATTCCMRVRVGGRACERACVRASVRA